MHREVAQGARQTAVLLRTARWVQQTRVKEGTTFYFDATEPTFRGVFHVDSIERSPIREPLRDRSTAKPVTGIFHTDHAHVYKLELEGGTVVRGTGGHPLYSLERDGWLGLSELRPGERVKTKDGSAEVEFVELLPQRESVYNIEVHDSHQYFVTRELLLSHNMNNKCWDGHEASRPATGREEMITALVTGREVAGAARLPARARSAEGAAVELTELGARDQRLLPQPGAQLAYGPNVQTLPKYPRSARPTSALTSQQSRAAGFPVAGRLYNGSNQNSLYGPGRATPIDATEVPDSTRFGDDPSTLYEVAPSYPLRQAEARFETRGERWRRRLGRFFGFLRRPRR